MGLLHEALPASTLVVAIDPGKVSNQVWFSTGEAGAVVPPLSLPVLRPGLDQLHRLVIDHAGSAGPVFAIARQSQGRPMPDRIQDALAAAVRHRRGLIAEDEVAQQRLHDQPHALCPGLAAPQGHGRALPIDSVLGQAVLDRAAACAGRPPAVRSVRLEPAAVFSAAKRSSGSIGGGPACHRRPTLPRGPHG